MCNCHPDYNFSLKSWNLADVIHGINTLRNRLLIITLLKLSSCNKSGGYSSTDPITLPTNTDPINAYHSTTNDFRVSDGCNSSANCMTRVGNGHS